MSNETNSNEQNIVQELNLEQRVVVKNIAGWPVGFARVDTVGDVTITADGSTKLTRGEIIAQVNSGNKLFNGIDDRGSHATLYIDDEATRKEIGFDGDDAKDKQAIFTDEAVLHVFTNSKTQSSFEKNLVNLIKTRAEKYAIIQAIKRLKINDYARIRFVEDYTGYKVQ